MLLFHCSDQIRNKLAGSRRTPSGHGIPTLYCLESLDVNIPVIDIVAAIDNITKILLCVWGCTYFIEGWINKTQGMTRHLISDGHDAGPEWRTGTGSPYLSPMTKDVVDHRSFRISIASNIRQAAMTRQF